MKKLIVLSTAFFVSMSVVLSPGLYAQDSIEEIVVTARKKEENLSEIPLSISVFSADDIQESGFKNLEDLSLQVAGFQHSAQGGQAPGRVNSQLRFRGMNVNSLSEDPSLNIATMFVDGIYVIGGYHSIPLEEVSRVEVVKGPQSALYGRSTFGGAVNYITKDPNTEETEGSIDLTLGEDGEMIFYGSFEGPITDMLSGRVSVKSYERDGIFKASDGGEMGEEETQTISGSLVAKGDNWKLKMRAFHSEDRDGGPAGGYILGYRNDSCTGKTVSTGDPANPTVNPSGYVCGNVPGPGSAIDYFGGTNVIDMNTSLSPLASSWLFGGSPVSPSFDGKVPSLPVGSYGMARDIDRINANFSYDMDNGGTIEASAGYNHVATMWVRDFDYTSQSNSSSRDPYISHDRTYDIKYISDQDQKLRFLVGMNRYQQNFIHRGQGGAIIIECVNSFGMPTPWGGADISQPQNRPCAPFLPNGYRGNNSVDSNTGNNSDNVLSTGIYLGIDYDISDQLTLSVEVRQQKEEIEQIFARSNINKLEFDNTLPRVILRYIPNDNSMFYASYSQGVLPGKANDSVANATDYELEQYKVAQPNVLRFLDEEELDSMEIGWKGTLLDGRATLSVALYQADWANQKGRSTAVVNESCRAADIGGTAANRVCNAIGDQVRDTAGNLVYNVRNFATMGDSEISGIEIEGNIALNDYWTLSGTLGMSDSEFKDYQYNFVTAFAKYSQMAGNTMPRYPEDMGSLSASYKNTMNNGWDMFFRADLNYFGETYADESNLATCDSYTLMNARGGVEKDNVRMELYVNNLGDEEAWTACTRWSDFASPSAFAVFTAFQGISVSPMRPRNIGLRISYDF